MRLLSTPGLCAALLVATLAVAGAPATAKPAAPRTVDGWPVRTPSSLGLRADALDAGAKVAKRRDSTCFAVLRNGKLAAEKNWRLERDTPREVFSITKSVTATLVGIAVRDGDLRLDDRVSTYVPQWRGTPSESVTVRNLLSNDSGRFWSMQSDYADLLGARNRTRYAVGLTQQYAPGSAWQYNNAAIQVLEPVLEGATGMPVARFARTRLFEPLGMTRSTFTTDRSGNANAFYGVTTTCLDLAHLGMLYLGRGEVDGRRYLDKAYVERAVGRSSTVHNAAYGYLWWLNRPGQIRGATDPVDAQGQPLRPMTGQLASYADEDVFAALGFGGQVLLVDPTTRTLVIRLGLPAQPGEQAYGFRDAATVLVKALRE
jgi:CubicO group peptidase (beta-lactamase class C family)